MTAGLFVDVSMAQELSDLTKVVNSYCDDYAEWLALGGEADTYAEMATKLRDFADFLDNCDKRWHELD